MTFPNDLVYFKKHEFQNADLMHIPFLRWLDRVRAKAGVPFTITNAARVAGTTEPVGSAGSKSLHRRGRAVDLYSRGWTAAQKWKVDDAIHTLASEAPGMVEFELVYSPTDQHWHLGVDDALTAEHELIESDE